MSARQLKTAVFPGTFDPVTNGHVDVIERGRKLFDQLIVAVGHNPEKQALFDTGERVRMLKKLTRRMKNVSVESFEGLTVDFVRRQKAAAILRGLRNVSDMEPEFQLALTNRVVAGVETVFIMTSEQYGFTSSSLIKEVAAMGGDVSALVPGLVLEPLKRKLQKI